MLKKLKLEGKVNKIMVFADAACELSKNEKFKECEGLESSFF
jgi:hypothetical protein